MAESNWQPIFAESTCKQTKILQFLVDALTNHEDVRKIISAAWHLGFVGPNAKTAIPALLEMLNTTNFGVWITGLNSLNKIGVPADELMPKLQEKIEAG